MRTLFDVPLDEYGIIEEINLNEDMTRRLNDIGVIKNTKVYCVGISPLGDPHAYLIRGAVIALRRCDSEKITVKD